MDLHKVTIDSINIILDSSLEEQLKLYRKIMVKQALASQNVWFNQQCIKRGLIPNYIHLTTNTKNSITEKILKNAKLRWLKEESKKWFRITDSLRVYLKVLRTELSFKLHNIEFDVFDNDIRELVSHINFKKYTTQQMKLSKLLLKKNGRKQPKFNTNNVDNNINFYPRFINLSDTQFTDSKKQFFNKSFKFCPFPKFTNEVKEILAVECESQLKKDIHQYTKHKIATLLDNIHSKKVH